MSVRLATLRGAMGYALAATALLATTVSAQVSGPVYPAPGGNLAAGTGSFQSGAAGRTVRYTNFDDSQFGDLYWTYNLVDLHINSGPNIMSFQSYNAGTGISRWTGTLNFFSPTAGNVSIATNFDMQLQPWTASGNSALGSGWLVPTTAGLAGIPGLPSSQSVLDNSAGNDFQVWTRMYDANTNVAILDRWNQFNHQGEQLNTGTGGAFYWTAEPPPVVSTPEPASLALFGTGLVGLVAVARKRKSA